MQELRPQLGLPQALMWGQQCRGPWRLQMVQGGLGWGHPGLGRWGVEKEAPQLGVGPRVLGPKDGSGRRWAGGCSWRTLGCPCRGLGRPLGLGLPCSHRGPHCTLRLGLGRTELE